MVTIITNNSPVLADSPQTAKLSAGFLGLYCESQWAKWFIFKPPQVWEYKCYVSLLKAEAGGWQVWGQLGQYSKTFSQKQTNCSKITPHKPLGRYAFPGFYRCWSVDALESEGYWISDICKNIYKRGLASSPTSPCLLAKESKEEKASERKEHVFPKHQCSGEKNSSLLTFCPANNLTQW